MTEDERAFQAYSKIAEQITKEDGLVNQWLTWGASINGARFLHFSEWAADCSKTLFEMRR